MAGKHSADDDFNPYRHQSNRQNEENIKRNSTTRNSKENYVAGSYNKTGSNRGVNSNSKVSNGNTNRTIKGKTGEVEDVERRKRVSKGNTKKKHKGLKIFAIFLLVIAIIVLLVAGGAFYFINDKIGKMQKVDINEGNLGISTNENLEGYRNIAIFGVDSRSNNLDVGNRSDCIIIANINNKTKEVKLISVYRDTYVQISENGSNKLDKITHAYAYGGPELAIQTLNTNLDLNIKEFVTVNFDSVAEAVDQLGGITMTLTSEEVDYANDYIRETARVTGKSATYISSSGKQTLNGVQAVAYSRIRYTSGGDYKRTERMRDVIEAMLAILKTKSLGEINAFADSILPKVYTNLDTNDILSLAPSVAKFNITESIGWPYETKGITLDRWYGVPVTLESNVEKLHREEFDDPDYEAPEKVKTISNKIINKTGYTD